MIPADTASRHPSAPENVLGAEQHPVPKKLIRLKAKCKQSQRSSHSREFGKRMCKHYTFKKDKLPKKLKIK